MQREGGRKTQEVEEEVERPEKWQRGRRTQRVTEGQRRMQMGTEGERGQ